MGNVYVPTVYVPMAIDLLHEGHINIINNAKELGRVTVGLLTDKAISEYKRLPILDYKQREIIIENIRWVSEVVSQESWDYEENIRKYKPDYFVHGDDWKTGVQRNMREKVIRVLKETGGKLIEFPYTKGVSSSQMAESLKKTGIMPAMRLKSLRKLLNLKRYIKLIEAHNGLTGLIAEKTIVEKGEKIEQFDGMWILLLL